ncbi:MAG: hypothetical protein ABFD51_05105 [Anaerolineaceae bacterium]
MTYSKRTSTLRDDDGDSYDLKILEPKQISMIDEALCSIGDFGEVRLVVEKGRLRFLITNKSFDVLKWQPGNLEK